MGGWAFDRCKFWLPTSPVTAHLGIVLGRILVSWSDDELCDIAMSVLRAIEATKLNFAARLAVMLLSYALERKSPAVSSRLHM